MKKELDKNLRSCVYIPGSVVDTLNLWNSPYVNRFSEVKNHERQKYFADLGRGYGYSGVCSSDPSSRNP
jgi:hypothetical protein